MDLLLVILIAVAMLLLALRGRRRRQSPPRPTAKRREREGWSFSRHSRQDWRYWRDLAILIGITLGILVAALTIGFRAD